MYSDHFSLLESHTPQKKVSTAMVYQHMVIYRTSGVGHSKVEGKEFAHQDGECFRNE